MQPKNQQIKFQKKKRSLKKKSRDLFWESQVVLVIKNLPANAGDIRDVGLIPRSGRYPGGGYNVLHDNVMPAVRIPQQEKRRPP